MRPDSNSRTGGEILVEQLVAQGVEQVFCVPGESYLAALDAFYDRKIKLTVCRQESGAAMMAEAVGKVTGRPGVCFVTRGPGATNASAGIHIASQDSTPMILLVGQVARCMRDREAFQELDYRAVFGTMAKWVTEVDNPERIPELISRAFFTAMNGRPGPVVIALPEDMLAERAFVDNASRSEQVEICPGSAEMSRLQEMLWAARRPVMIVGGSRWSPGACRSLAVFAERLALPVYTTFRRGHLFDALHDNYGGDLGVGPSPKLLARIKSADLVLLVGGRLGEIPSQSYSLLDVPQPQAKLIQVHPGAEELGRVYHPALAIQAAPTGFCSALEAVRAPGVITWRDHTKAAHAEYLAWTEKATDMPGPVNLGDVIVYLREQLAAEGFICNGAGNFASWVHRFFRFRRFAQHVAPTSGSMGYGLPAAVAIKTLYPQSPVVCVAGDGDFLMTGQEFATAVQNALPIIVIIADNGTYGTIRMHQEREYPGRTIATTLTNPDFVAYAKAFGGFGVAVEKTADFPAAYAAAISSNKPAIIHLKLDPEGISPTATLSGIRAAAFTTS